MLYKMTKRIKKGLEKLSNMMYILITKTIKKILREMQEGKRHGIDERYFNRLWRIGSNR